MVVRQLNGADSRLSWGSLIAVTAWRLLIAGCAFFGFAAAADRMFDPWPELSQQASVFTGSVYLGFALYPLLTGGRRHEPRSPWLRGATTVLMVLVAVTYFSVMDGRIDQTWSLFEHLITPLLVLADWLMVGRNQAAVRWWHPISWIALPLAYAVYVNVADVRVYQGMLEIGDPDFAWIAPAFIAAILAIGYLLYATGRARAGRAERGWARAAAPETDASPGGDP